MAVQPQLQEGPVSNDTHTDHTDGSLSTLELPASNNMEDQAQPARSATNETTEVIKPSTRQAEWNRHSCHAETLTDLKRNYESTREVQKQGSVPRRWVRVVVDHRYFTWFISTVILINSAYIGVETQEAWLKGDDESMKMPWYMLEVMFVVIFTLEIALRVAAYGARLVTSSADRGWNIFDIAIVTVAIVDCFIIGPLSDGGSFTDALLVIRMARLARMLRVLRVFRILRFCDELRIMVMGMVSALRTLFWAWMLLILVIYICSIFVTRTIGQELPHQEDVQEFFGTIPKSTFSLFQVLTVDDWVDIVKAAEKVDGNWFVRPFFVTFVIITTFAILNMVVAVIVEKTLENSLNHEEARLKEVTSSIKKSNEMVHRIFLMGDQDNDETLSKAEFLDALSKPCVMRFLHEVGVEVRRADNLFDILDYDESGVLDLGEFVEGVMNARGEARSKDLLEIQCGLWRWEYHQTKQVKDLKRAADKAASGMINEVASIREAVGRLKETVAPLLPLQGGQCTRLRAAH